MTRDAIPDPRTQQRIDAYTATLPPTFAETCAEIAAQFARLSREAYRDGDEPRGDRLFARSLDWAIAADEGTLPTRWVR